MSPVLSPIESEFPTVAEAEAYDLWFRAKVQEAIASKETFIAHDAVMAEAAALIQAARNKTAAS